MTAACLGWAMFTATGKSGIGMEAGRIAGLVVFTSGNDEGGHFVSGRLLWCLGC